MGSCFSNNIKNTMDSFKIFLNNSQSVITLTNNLKEERNNPITIDQSLEINN